MKAKKKIGKKKIARGRPVSKKRAKRRSPATKIAPTIEELVEHDPVIGLVGELCGIIAKDVCERVRLMLDDQKEIIHENSQGIAMFAVQNILRVMAPEKCCVECGWYHVDGPESACLHIPGWNDEDISDEERSDATGASDAG